MGANFQKHNKLRKKYRNLQRQHRLFAQIYGPKTISRNFVFDHWAYTLGAFFIRHGNRRFSENFIIKILEDIYWEARKKKRIRWIVEMGDKHLRPDFLYAHLRLRFPKWSMERERKKIINLKNRVLGISKVKEKTKSFKIEEKKRVFVNKNNSLLKLESPLKHIPLELVHHAQIYLKWEDPARLFISPDYVKLFAMAGIRHKYRKFDQKTINSKFTRVVTPLNFKDENAILGKTSGMTKNSVYGNLNKKQKTMFFQENFQSASVEGVSKKGSRMIRQHHLKSNSTKIKKLVQTTLLKNAFLKRIVKIKLRKPEWKRFSKKNINNFFWTRFKTMIGASRKSAIEEQDAFSKKFYKQRYLKSSQRFSIKKEDNLYRQKNKQNAISEKHGTTPLNSQTIMKPIKNDVEEEETEDASVYEETFQVETTKWITEQRLDARQTKFYYQWKPVNTFSWNCRRGLRKKNRLMKLNFLKKCTKMIRKQLTETKHKNTKKIVYYFMKKRIKQQYGQKTSLNRKSFQKSLCRKKTINILRQGATLPLVHYYISEIRLVDIEEMEQNEGQDTPKRFLFIERKYGRVSYNQLLGDLFSMITPALKLMSQVVGHKSSRRTVYQVRGGLSLEERRRAVFGWVKDFVNKNGKYNHLIRNVARKPASKKIRLRPVKSQRLTTSFFPRLYVELKRMLTAEEPIMEQLKNFDQKVGSLKPARRHFRWDI